MRKEFNVVDVARIEVVGGDEGGKHTETAGLRGCCVRFPVVAAEDLGVAARNPTNVVAVLISQGTGYRVVLVRAYDARLDDVGAVGRSVHEVERIVGFLEEKLTLSTCPPLISVRA